MAVLTVLAVSQAVGLVGLLVWVLVSGDTFPGVASSCLLRRPESRGSSASARCIAGSRSVPWGSSRRSRRPPRSCGSPRRRAGRRFRRRCSGSASGSCSPASRCSRASRRRRERSRRVRVPGSQSSRRSGSGCSSSGSTQDRTRARRGRSSPRAPSRSSWPSLAALVLSTSLRPSRGAWPLLDRRGHLRHRGERPRRDRLDARARSGSSPC